MCLTTEWAAELLQMYCLSVISVASHATRSPIVQMNYVTFGSFNVLNAEPNTVLVVVKSAHPKPQSKSHTTSTQLTTILRQQQHRPSPGVKLDTPATIMV